MKQYLIIPITEMRLKQAKKKATTKMKQQNEIQL